MPDLNIENISDEPSVYNKTDLPVCGRIAVYDNMRSIPRVIDFRHNTVKTFIDEVPQKIYALSHELGGRMPYTILKEVVENLIHADFKDIIITILDNGNNIIISDQGPGIPDKEKAFLPGYTSATSSMKKYIRGVGSGLPIVRETIVFSGGSVDIDSNIKKGTVVSLKIVGEKRTSVRPQDKSNSISIPEEHLKNVAASLAASGENAVSSVEPVMATEKKPPAQAVEEYSIKLSIRQKKILSLMLELEESGPAKIAKELDFSLSTSYRELIFLEKLKFLAVAASGKRILTPKGKKYLEYYSNSF
ncbi:MAG: hypothetical protein FJW68_06190 [Actinobacteria bacterium]|nr:hypothetical protein [Actinomycetota bacterium]